MSTEKYFLLKKLSSVEDETILQRYYIFLMQYLKQESHRTEAVILTDNITEDLNPAGLNRRQLPTASEMKKAGI